jgi:hypothetical protein
MKGSEMPATAERVYVTCDEYCANRISDPNVDHDKNCGAPLAYRNSLAKALQAKKIKAAAGSEPILTEGGAVLLTEDGRPLMTEAPKTTRKRRGEVDGREANIHHDPPAEEAPPARDYSALWRDPHVDVAWVFALQAKIDAAEIEIGGISAGKACIGKMTADDDGSPVEVDCTHATVLRHIRKNTCNLDHQHSETLAQVCLIHAITSWGGGIAPAGNGPLFAEPT